MLCKLGNTRATLLQSTGQAGRQNAWIRAWRCAERVYTLPRVILSAIQCVGGSPLCR